MNWKGENMKGFWKEKSRQILAAVLTAVMLAGTWGTCAGAAVLEDGYPEQEVLQEEAAEIKADTDGPDTEPSGETLENERNEPESELPGEIQLANSPYTHSQKEQKEQRKTHRKLHLGKYRKNHRYQLKMPSPKKTGKRLPITIPRSSAGRS